MKGYVNLLLFWGIIGTIGVAHSLLLTNDTPWENVTYFYIVTWATSSIILLACWVRFKEQDQFDYDDPLHSSKLFYIVGGVIATFFISIVLVQSYTRSSIWVPQPQQTLAISGLSLSSVVNDLFYQLALVSNSEETMVLASSQVIRKKLATSLPGAYQYLTVPLAVVLPRVGWGTLHAYVAYVGPLQWLLVASAIISGIVISYCAYNRKVESFLVAVMIHFLFNASVVIGAAFGLV